MAAIQPLPPQIRPADRLGLALFGAVVVHAVVILGITFGPLDNKSPPITATLDITLAQDRSDKAPDDADLLAQANQQGGGDKQARDRSSSPANAPLLKSTPGDTAEIQLQSAAPRPVKSPLVPVLTQQEAERAIALEELPVPDHETAVTAAELMQRSMEIANLTAEVNESLESYSKNPRHRYISSNTREYRDAAYLDGWRKKVEQIGNLNYPEEARRRNLSGSLILHVAIRADGTPITIDIRRSSGSKILDDAAKRIVQLAAPYAAFSDGMRKDTDVLHITRTWQFQAGNRFSGE
ncbi:MAG: periplasmic protein TonB [Gammaproteobacteria bacterium]|nr:MAG: periplasmic protein TonB [Gammaproteobacteria bacterium]TND05310.1 MAG: periplasmic protein TonB [Gammaproteobacteria bacterium]